MANITGQVVLRIKEKDFSCSRKLLADNSQYFSAMFTSDFKEKHQDVINLQDVEPDAIGFIINTLNRGEIDFATCENVLDVLMAASMLQFDFMLNLCTGYIQSTWMDKDMWLTIANLADKLSLTDLKRTAKTLALWYFSEVRKTEQFLCLSFEEIIDYLNDDTLRTVEGEFEVFEAGVTWIEHSPDDRLFHSIPLLKAVRFKQVEPFDIRNMLHFSSVKDTPQAELIVECILEIINGVLNQKCETCNPPLVDDQDSVDSGQSSPLTSGVFFKQLKKKQRTTSKCTCFDNQTMETAKELVNREGRCLPLVPCVVASFPSSLQVRTHFLSPRQIVGQKNKRPFVFQWDGTKLSPFVHLKKIDQGLAGPVGYTVVTKDFRLYVIGGEFMMGHGDWNTSVWFYDTCKDFWQFETSLPFPLRHQATLCINDDIYVMGGVSRYRATEDCVNKYNLVTKTWESCTSLPSSVCSPPCCVYQNDIYLFGPLLYCYRQAVSNWEIISKFVLPDKMSAAVAMSDDNTIFVIGINGKLYSFVPRPDEIEVSTLGQFKVPTGNACLVNKSIFSFADEDNIQSVEQYDIHSKTFNILSFRQKEDHGEAPYYNLTQAAGCFPFPKYF